MSYQLIIFEDNTRLRQSLEILLNDETNFRVVAAYPDCDKADKQVEQYDAHLVLMDIDMPGIGGLEGLKKIKDQDAGIKVVMHTVFDDDNRIFEAICSGADGYLLKNTSPLQLVNALLEVMQGGAPMSPFVAQKVFEHFRRQKVVAEEFHLTQREKEILEQLVKGNSYKMIAYKTYVSIETVKKHLQNIYHKLHVNCGTEAVAKAIRHKIVKTD